MHRLSDAAPEASVDRLVRIAYDHLEMGVVMVSEFTDGKQVYRAIAGDAIGFGLVLEDGPPLDETYCALMVDGQIPNVIPDAIADEQLRELRDTAATGVGAYVGVPLYLPNGDLYGSFCGLSRYPSPDLNSRDAKFLALLGDLLAEDLARDRELHDTQVLIGGVIQTQSLRIALQPVVDLLTGRCTSVEALSRFQPPLGSPDVVFRQAAEVGLGLELETLAVAKAVELLPVLAPDQSLAVNLSPDIALQLMPRTEVDRPLHQLTLEITEHAVVQDYRRIRDAVAPLRERGLRLSIDDAGAGFASLRHIIELRPDIIKIDRALIAGIDTDPGRRSALTTFVLLALDIGATLVAEGVETKQELAVVASLGVDAAQGYYVARPSSDPADLARWTSGAPLL